MLFNSLTFIVFFVVVLSLHYTVKSWRGQKSILLIASYIFYAAWNPPFVVLLWLSTLVDWYVAKALEDEETQLKRRLLLTVSLTVNLGLLGFFKYGEFLLENFIELANKFYDKKVFDYVYLICGKDKQYIAKDIIAKSNKNYFIDCSDLKLIDIISVIKDSDFFVGNNSGPLNLAAALNVKSFGLFANTPISQLKFSKVIPLVPENYVDNQFIKDRKEMKKLTPDKVFLDITKHLTD